MRATMPLVWLVLAFAFLVVAGIGLPPPPPLRAGQARATLIARGPGGSVVSGSSGALAVCADAGELVLTMPLASIETGFLPRDRRLRELLDGDRYPVAELRVIRTALAVPGGEASMIDGDLSLHGVTRRLPVEVRSWLDASGRARAQATVQVDLRAFELESLRELGVTASSASVTAEFWLDSPPELRQAAAPAVRVSGRRWYR